MTTLHHQHAVDYAPETRHGMRNRGRSRIVRHSHQYGTEPHTHRPTDNYAATDSPIVPVPADDRETLYQLGWG